MNILMISTDRRIFTEGTEVRQRMAAYGTLAEELHIIVFAKKTLGFSLSQIAPNVWVYPTSSRNRWLYVRNAVALGRRIAKERKLDLVTTQDPFEVGLAGLRVAQKAHTALQVQVHTDFLNPQFLHQSLLNRLRVRIARRVLPAASCIRVVSTSVKRSLGGIFPKLTNRIEVLPIFVDIKRIREHVPAFSMKEKFPQFTEHILCVGRLEPEKNLSLALRVFQQITISYPRAGLIIVGEGAMRTRLMDEARDLGIHTQVIFEGTQADVASYYKTADVFLLTSGYEGYGMVLVEAAAADCPIVTTDVGIARDLMQNSEQEFVCPVGDAGCLAREVIRLLKNKSLREVAVLKTQAVLEHLVVPDSEIYLKRYGDLWRACVDSFLSKS
ncbi:MAG: glycosyltransferase [Minisyncoccota bacterium]